MSSNVRVLSLRDFQFFTEKIQISNFFSIPLLLSVGELFTQGGCSVFRDVLGMASLEVSVRNRYHRSGDSYPFDLTPGLANK